MLCCQWSFPQLDEVFQELVKRGMSLEGNEMELRERLLVRVIHTLLSHCQTFFWVLHDDMGKADVNVNITKCNEEHNGTILLCRSRRTGGRQCQAPLPMRPMI